MVDLQVGQVVFSKAGHDKRRAFVIISIEGEYAYLSDGDTRRLDHPKKKKFKHLQPTRFIDIDVLTKLNENKLFDSDVRKILIQYQKM